jgi:hypothetical protein
MNAQERPQAIDKHSTPREVVALIYELQGRINRLEERVASLEDRARYVSSEVKVSRE